MEHEKPDTVIVGHPGGLVRHVRLCVVACRAPPRRKEGHLVAPQASPAVCRLGSRLISLIGMRSWDLFTLARGGLRVLAGLR